MRRFLAVFILCLVPLQWGYAAMAEYCRHEAAPAAQVHVGHHDHEHADKATASEKDNPGGVADLDCPACHLLGSGTVDARIAATGPEPAVTVELSLYQPFRQRFPGTPFRPPLASGS